VSTCIVVHPGDVAPTDKEGRHKTDPRGVPAKLAQTTQQLDPGGYTCPIQGDFLREDLQSYSTAQDTA